MRPCLLRPPTRLALTLLAWLIGSPVHAIIGGGEAPQLRNHLIMIVSDHGGLCSGVVLDRRHILTAGHCVANRAAYRLHWRDEHGKPILAEPETIVLHPDFKANAPQTRQRSIDLAIITSAQDLPSEFEPVRLVSSGRPSPDKGTPLTLAGYGLQKEQDPNSAGTLKAVSLPVIMPYGPGRILVWLGNGRDGACGGDSGGGIFTDEGALIALTIWSEGQGKNLCGAHTQGLLIAPQRAWIAKQLEASSKPRSP